MEVLPAFQEAPNQVRYLQGGAGRGGASNALKNRNLIFKRKSPNLKPITKLRNVE
jgi:hypothetical protein